MLTASDLSEETTEIIRENTEELYAGYEKFDGQMHGVDVEGGNEGDSAFDAGALADSLKAAMQRLEEAMPAD